MRLPENLWYPILLSGEAKRKPRKLLLLGLDWVVWRSSSGQVAFHLDRCPHLGASLSQGTICNDRLVCPFHGFEYSLNGQCAWVPAIGKHGTIPKGLHLSTALTQEQHGFIWLWWGEQRERYPEIPYFEPLKGDWRYATIKADWPVHHTRAIENQLDVAHLPFVHRNTIGKGHRTLVEGPHVEVDGDEIRVWVTNQKDLGQPSRNATELKQASEHTEPSLWFKFPGIWLLNISPSMKLFVAFVPVDQTTTRFYVRSYHRMRLPLIGTLYSWLLGIANRFILRQDQTVVVRQLPKNSMNAGEDQLIGADRAIHQFRKQYAKRLNTNE